jgi:hypothetical protein
VRRVHTLAAALVTAALPAVGWSQPRLEPAPRPPVTAPPVNEPSEPIAILDGVVAAVAATVVTVPASIGMARAMTLASPDFLGGAIPALLFLGFAPPFAAHGLGVVAMNLHEPRRYNLWPSIFATVPLHLGAVVLGSVLGVNLRDPATLLPFVIAEAIVLPAVSITLSWVSRRPRARPPAARARSRPALDVAAVRAPLVRAAIELRSVEATPALPGIVAPLFAGRF